MNNKRKKNSRRRPKRLRQNAGYQNQPATTRSLVPGLPGADGSRRLNDLVDMNFSMIGYTTDNAIIKDTSLSITNVNVIGLSGVTFPTYANILSRNPASVRDFSRGARIWFTTPFVDAKLEHLQIVALPDNKIASRSGKWSMAFVPFRNVSDLTELSSTYVPLELARVQSLPGAITANADRPLRVRYTPIAEDGYIYQFNKIDQAFGAVILAFSDEVRTAYGLLSADDFAPNVTIRGKLKLRQPNLGASMTSRVEDAPVQFSDPPYLRVLFKNAQNGIYSFTFASNGVVTDQGTSLKVTGLRFNPKLKRPGNLALSLDEMAIE